ncbi:MAG: hypothetical protein ACLSGI_09800 [Butyricicoccaceae bacterium]
MSRASNIAILDNSIRRAALLRRDVTIKSMDTEGRVLYARFPR